MSNYFWAVGALALAVVGSPALAAEAEAPICTDRPTKANGTCTVPAGKFQLEVNLANWSLTNIDGVRTELFSSGLSFIKFGLTDRSDLQIGFTPYSRLSVKADGVTDHISGVGDLFIRYKHRLTSDDAKAQVGIIPFVKIPTAKDGIGNGKVEGGIAVPIAFTIGKASLTFGPEVDLLADADGSGRHAALVNLVNVGMPVADRLTLALELWSNFNFDPDGTVRQASADAALAYLLSDRLQLDIGANAGLTKDTPDIEIYGGLSVRF
jgi:hypothetical protein